MYNSNGSVYFPASKIIARPDNSTVFGDHFKWIDTRLLSLTIWHPWYAIEYGLKGEKAKPFVPEDMHGFIMKGDRQKHYYIENMTKRR